MPTSHLFRSPVEAQYPEDWMDHEAASKAEEGLLPALFPPEAVILLQHRHSTLLGLKVRMPPWGGVLVTPQATREQSFIERMTGLRSGWEQAEGRREESEVAWQKKGC